MNTIPWAMRHKVLATLVVCLALALEISIAWYLWNAGTSGESVDQAARFLLPHFIACIMLAAVLVLLLPTRYHAAPKGALLFMFSLGFFIPLFGALGLICVLAPALWWPKKDAEDEGRLWSYQSMPELPSHMPEAGRDGVRISDNAKIMNVLQGAADPHQRQTSVLETLRLPDVSAIPLLRRALRDSEDDVRLLAYALLDRKEQAISSRMRKLEQRLASAEPDQSFNFHKLIAQDCWELIHLGLAQGEVLNHLLVKAREHAEDALLLNPHNAGLQFLLGRILLSQREYKLAATAFHQAVRSGIDSVKVKPYLAEIDFSRQHFTKISGQLGNIETLVPGQILHAPVVYWQGHG